MINNKFDYNKRKHLEDAQFKNLLFQIDKRYEEDDELEEEIMIERGSAHSNRVCRCAEVLASVFRLNKRERHLLSLGAYVHEFGYAKCESDSCSNTRSFSYCARYMKAKSYSREDINEMREAIIFCHSGNKLDSKIGYLLFVADKLDNTRNRINLDKLELSTDEKYVNLSKVIGLNLAVEKERAVLYIKTESDFDYDLYKKTFFKKLYYNLPLITKFFNKEVCIKLNGETIEIL